MRRGWYIEARRWPWQKANHRALLSSDSERKMTTYGWRPTDGMGRFGGGWNWKLGVSMGHLLPGPYGWSVHIDLLFGMVTVGYHSQHAVEMDRAWRKDREK
jgi:hypothetical protein